MSRCLIYLLFECRKFNQHQHFAKILNSIIGDADCEVATLCIEDGSEWVSFIALRQAFQKQFPKKGLSKFQEMSSLLLMDKRMIEVGLPCVIQTVIQKLTRANQVVIEMIPKPIQLGLEDVKADEMSAPAPAFVPLAFGSATEMALAGYRYNPLERAVEVPRHFVTFMISEKNNRNLTEIFGDGSIVTTCIALEEGIDVILVDKLTPIAWMYKAINSARLGSLLNRGSIRVALYDTVISPDIPSI